MWNDLIYVGAAAPLIIAIFVAIAVWRSASAQRTRRALQEGLTSADPAVRRATLDGVVVVRSKVLKCRVGVAPGDPPAQLDDVAVVGWLPAAPRDRGSKRVEHVGVVLRAEEPHEQLGIA